jgi:hypothetical protein
MVPLQIGYVVGMIARALLQKRLIFLRKIAIA